MRRFHLPCLAAALSWLILSACSALEPKADPSRFFTLAPKGQLDQGRSRDSLQGSLPSIGIGPVNFPGYLDREQIVTRASQNRLQIAENDRWGEPLAENFTRVLMENLAAQLPTSRFVRYPWRSTERPVYQLKIDVLRFEPHTSGNVELMARWIVSATASTQAFSNETHLTLPANGSSTEAAVAALSLALGELSEEIGKALRGLEAKGQP